MDDDFDAGPARGADDRPRGVPKGKLNDVNLDQKISIFYRPDRRSAMIPLESTYPKEAATIFCDRIHAELERSKSRSYVITGGDPTAYKQIFTWINDCVQTQSIEKFPDIPEPEDDPFTPTINVILAGERLGVPAGSLSYHLKKRLNGCARKHLMPFSQVQELYNINSETYPLGLKDIACSSIFNAWWDARLDESVTPELMEELADMRDDLKELDKDLHEACMAREEEIRKKWAEKKAKKGGEQKIVGSADANTVGGGADSWDNAGTGVVTSDDWNSTAPGLTNATSPTSGDWSDENAIRTEQGASNKHKEFEKTVDDRSGDTHFHENTGSTWADEMNDPAHETLHAVNAPQW